MSRVRPRIMLVEDEALIAVELADLLGFFGCQVDAVFGVLDDAMKWLEAREEPLDGAVLDINLGGEMVFPLADRLRERGVPFVFATGYGSMDELVRYKDAVVLAKPIVDDDLESAVRRFQHAA